MVEFKKANTTRGYYVKMKLLHGQQGRSNNKYLCYKYFKWMLWGSLFLYFASSYFITSSTKQSSHLNTISSHSKSRTLLESTNATVVRNPIKGSFNNMKIYIYNLPSKYNIDWLSNPRCSNHLFASEVAIHRALLNSDVRTEDPTEADFFFVPVYLSCNFSTVNGFPSMGHARPLLASAVELISSTMPFWNRSNGSDHLFVASHDFGACFHSVEELAIKDGIPEFLKNSIILQTFGVKYPHPCQAVENVLIPPYISPTRVERTPASGKRDILVFFRGKMEVHPKNISGQFYSRGVRSMIWHKFSRNRNFRLKRERFDGYQSEIQRSVFCLCPLGWAPWSPRLAESVALGCVPVIIADGIRLPFSETIQWPKISVTVKEKDVNKLSKMLKHVAATNLATIQKNLWDPVNKRAMLYNEVIQPGDATWLIMNSLSQKLHRSYRRVNLRSEDT